PAPEIQRQDIPEEEELLMRSPAPEIQRQGALEEEELLQGKLLGRGGFPVNDQTRQELAIQQGRGAPLPSQLRSEMEMHFDADFSNVRVHTDGQSAKLNQRLRARAFTHRADIYFDTGLYDPATSQGKHLLAHELTHVVQQGAAERPRKQTHPAPAELSPALSSIHQDVQREDDDEETRLDKITGAMGSSAVGTGSSVYENIINWTTQNPYKMGPDEWSAKTPNETQYTKMGGGVGAGLSGAKTVLDIGGTYSGFRDIYNARKVRTAPNASPLKKELAWKKEKGGAKTAGAGVLATTGDVLSTISGGITAAGKTASALSSTAGGFGVGVGAIDLGRNLWGMGRSAHKARQLGGWTGKGGLVEEIGKKESSLTGIENQDKKKEMQSLGDIAKYAHKHKARSAGLKALGAVGAGLGVAGGIAALASNPVGWALAGVGAGVGLGIGAYKLGRGMWKRSHRRDKLTEAEKTLGLTRPQESKMKRFGKWITGKDIDERREAIKTAMTQRNAPPLPPRTGSTTPPPLPPRPLTPDQKLNIERALKTEKQRKSEKLIEHMTSGSTEGKGFANRIGSTLGVTTSEGKVKQSRGWKFWKSKTDLDVGQVDTKEKKEELAELLGRKLGSS
ncbi:MAG: DUF4157 domain-containing protein, partial [Anaerolineales bacterium]|nr:DUF4157 domain-containing protein [Anaerolineales bacterium]